MNRHQVKKKNDMIKLISLSALVFITISCSQVDKTVVKNDSIDNEIFNVKYQTLDKYNIMGENFYRIVDTTMSYKDFKQLGFKRAYIYNDDYYPVFYFSPEELNTKIPVRQRKPDKVNLSKFLHKGLEEKFFITSFVNSHENLSVLYGFSTDSLKCVSAENNPDIIASLSNCKDGYCYATLISNESNIHEFKFADFFNYLQNPKINLEDISFTNSIELIEDDLKIYLIKKENYLIWMFTQASVSAITPVDNNDYSLNFRFFKTNLDGDFVIDLSKDEIKENKMIISDFIWIEK
jgi:hypothetical protein